MIHQHSANKNIVILGGGTAGWMAANLLQHHLAPSGFCITLIESPEIGIVGVGEGSTPQLKMFFNTLGIAENDWMPACNATYKNGISFVDWSNEPGFSKYFHPFPSHSDRQTAKPFLLNCMARRKGSSVHAHPDRFFLSAYLAEHELSPIRQSNQGVPINYAYHFDAVLLGKYLSKRAVAKGVTHIQARAKDFINHANGDIASILTACGQHISGDIFIDCSGFRSLLLQQHLAVNFNSYQSSLFNDAAIALPSPGKTPLKAQTVSRAMDNGWAWDIPLTNRTGNGYVYSSAFISADDAEVELRTKLAMLDSDVPARRLSMKIGRVEQHWAKNCLAVGLSQGFIEPLEATALHLVQETIESFVSAFTAGNFTAQHQGQFNQRINARFDGIRDYISCHYKVNTRSDTEYWRANRENMHISDSLRHILDCWDKGGDITAEIERQGIAAYYPAVSWHCLLAGYGRFAPLNTGKGPVNDDKILLQIDGFIKRCAKQFKGHQDALEFT